VTKIALRQSMPTYRNGERSARLTYQETPFNLDGHGYLDE
jgi:hypothetical protein